MSTQTVTINGKRGEYTGFSRINGVITHYFSMYDGSVIRRASLGHLDIVPFELFVLDIVSFEAPKELGGLHNYNCIRP